MQLIMVGRSKTTFEYHGWGKKGYNLQNTYPELNFRVFFMTMSLYMISK